VTYSKSERVTRIDEVENDIARECLRLLEIDPPIYISTIADLPASTGLGGSSSFAVGLLNALHTFRGERVSAGQLAEEASHIEIDVLGEPIGKQDQYAAAFGGLNAFCFKPDGGVTVQHQRLAPGVLNDFFSSLLMFWTGHQRDASKVLAEQKRNTDDQFERLRKMRDQAFELQGLVGGSERFDARAFGGILDEGWRMKRHLASSITTSQIDIWYEAALDAGALGGKLCGAGGGGFLLFVAPRERHQAVREALGGLLEITVGHEAQGSQVMVPFHS
jgi:D-glycero-alpha-D-manno-heptose-7-phosphate kinase